MGEEKIACIEKRGTWENTRKQGGASVKGTFEKPTLKMPTIHL